MQTGINQQIQYEGVLNYMIQNCPNESVDFPSYNSLRSIVSRCSLKNRPSDPTLDIIETFHIPFAFRTTLGENGANFVLHRASVQNQGHTNRLEGYIVLGDVQILEHLFTDGTFSFMFCH